MFEEVPLDVGDTGSAGHARYTDEALLYLQGVR